MRTYLLLLLMAGATSLGAKKIKLLVLDSPSGMVQVRVMVQAGSAYDPPGREGLAALTAEMLIEGGFGPPGDPVTKEKLAEITRPWGSAARPNVRVEKETSTFRFTVPLEAFADFAARIMKPMFTQPLFAAEELDRLRKETHVYIESTLRLENTELLGLYALDNYIHEGTPYGHLPEGTVQGVGAVAVGDLQRFYRSYYTAKNITVGVSTSDQQVHALIQDALSRVGRGIKAKKLRPPKASAAPAITGRQLLIVSQPTTIATGIHLGFPIQLGRQDPDYWPLYVANVAFGTHRDSFGRLYSDIRNARGYNYGDYSYIEWFQSRPFVLFPPPNVPRREQYFSIWIRPVAHEYAHHITKAATWELEHLIADGLTATQVEQAKNKAKVLYLNLAETAGRLLSYRMDDDFYRLDQGYLDSYLEAIDRVTADQANSAIRRHLQSAHLKYVIVTDEEWASRLAEDIAAGSNAKGKGPAEYNLEGHEENGELVYDIPPEMEEIISQDQEWENHPLNIPAGNIRVVSSEQLFENARLIEP
ncbi:MAG: insulinase family protein [Candidatus Marinimicrobia bacterium]|nr:insulinase family protein [Candidatus Neomarinimicrobiota bacterium]